jgi:hypothetical protein
MTQYGNVQFDTVPVNVHLDLSIGITTIEKENIDRLKIIGRKLNQYNDLFNNFINQQQTITDDFNN